MARDPFRDALLRGELRAQADNPSDDVRSVWFPVLAATTLLVSAIFAFVAGNSSPATSDVRGDGSPVRYELGPS